MSDDEALGGFLAGIFGDSTHEGPPYAHTLAPPPLPDPIGVDADGGEVYPPRPRDVPFTLTGPDVPEPEPDPGDAFCPACDELIGTLPAGHVWGISSGTGDWICTATGLVTG